VSGLCLKRESVFQYKFATSIKDSSRLEKTPGRTTFYSLSTAIQALIDDELITPVGAKTMARLINDIALNAALWTAASDEPALLADVHNRPETHFSPIYECSAMHCMRMG
jgi:hypothetical protein